MVLCTIRQGKRISQPGRQEGGKNGVQAEFQGELLEEIEALAWRIEDGDYCDGRRRDGEIREERDGGD